MIFKHCKLIQEKEAILFYMVSRPLKGYVVAGVIVAPGMAGKLAFAKIWNYFTAKVVRGDDIYCSINPGVVSKMYDMHMEFHTEIDGLKIYKIDNPSKEHYTSRINKLKERI